METAGAQTTTTLLTLPFEIRRLILGYTFIAACAPTYPDKKYSDLDIQVTPVLDHRIEVNLSKRHLIRLNARHGAWGKEPMSRILRINHQLLSEATEVLYGGDFVFHFPASRKPSDVHHWLHVIGDKKSLVKKIGVCYNVRLGQFSMSDASGRRPGHRAEGFATLKRELVNLKSVEMRIVFLRTPYWSDESDEGRQRDFDALTDLVGIFRGLATLVIESDMAPDTSWKDLVDVCVEKMEEAVK
jgi:hypothetical protein